MPRSRTAIVLARLAASLVVALIVGGTLWYGLSFEDLDRLWKDILARPRGPMSFRFILQPTMALIAARRDGVSDARLGRKPYLSALLEDPHRRSALLWDGIILTARILIIGIVMDVIYQWLVLETFYPGQAAVIAILLAFVPYLLTRGPFTRLAAMVS
jgi:hypothetical protein